MPEQGSVCAKVTAGPGFQTSKERTDVRRTRRGCGEKESFAVGPPGMAVEVP